MLFSDALTLDAPRRTADGYMAVRAKAARTGVYQYVGREVDPDNKHGLRDQAVVNVLRDEAAVFDTKSAHSFIGKPVTDDHPSVAVNAGNWRDYARGTVMGAKWEEGGYLAFDLLLTDAAAIKAVENGKRELSNGYSADLSFGDFKAADGTECQAKQVSIAGNHVAIVAKGRAGPSCAISDSVALCDANPAAVAAFTQEKQVKKIVLDGLQVDLSDADAVQAAISKLQDNAATLSDKLVAADAAAVTAAATIVAKDAEIADLTAKLADAAITPAKLADAAKEYSDVQAKAKAVGVQVAADADTAAIKKAVVDAKMGDTAKGYTADHIDIAFTALTKDAKVTPGVQPLGSPVVIGDAANVEQKALNDANNYNAWRTASAA